MLLCVLSFQNLVSLTEGGRSICWADEKKELVDKVLKNVLSEDSIALSPLMESEVRLDVPPTSVLSRPLTNSLSARSCSTSSLLNLPDSSAHNLSPLKFDLDSTVVLERCHTPTPLDATVVIEPSCTLSVGHGKMVAPDSEPKNVFEVAEINFKVIQKIVNLIMYE